MTRDEIVAEARTWLGTSWAHQGRSEQAVDCVGLVVCVGLALGAPIFDKTGYRRAPNQYEFLRHLENNLPPGDRINIKDGSLGVFRQAQYPCHIGIFTTKLGKRHLLHSHMLRRTVLEEPFEVSEWADRLVDVREYPGVVD